MVSEAAVAWDPWVCHALAERAGSFSTQAPDVVAALLTDGDLMVRAAAAQHAALSRNRQHT